MTTVARRLGSLALTVGTRQLTLYASDVAELIETANSPGAGLSRLGGIGSLTETLAVAPSVPGGAPLELDLEQLRLLRCVVDVIAARGELTPALRELERALDAVSTLAGPPR